MHESLAEYKESFSRFLGFFSYASSTMKNCNKAYEEMVQLLLKLT